MKWKKSELTKVEIVYKDGTTQTIEDVLFAKVKGCGSGSVLNSRTVYGDIYQAVVSEIRNVNYLKYHSDEIIKV